VCLAWTSHAIDLLYQGLEHCAAFQAFTQELCVALNANAASLSLLDEDSHAPTGMGLRSQSQLVALLARSLRHSPTER
jgi:hypothetical protein